MSEYDPLYNNFTAQPNDRNFIDAIKALYGNALHAKGLNILDPIRANMFHYNKQQNRVQADFPGVSKTVVFFTRPELNFTMENISAIPFFKWVHAKEIGRMCMASLTDPEFYINAPSIFNTKLTPSQYYSAMTQYMAEGRKYTTAGVLKGNKDALNKLEEQAQADLAAINLDSLDTTGYENFPSSADKAYASANSNIDDELYGSVRTSMGNPAYTNENGTKIYGSVDKAFDATITKAKNIIPNGSGELNFTSPFIPIIQNTCTSLTGGSKDFNLETFQYESDYFGTNLMVPTGMDEIWGSGSFTTTHDDIAYGPVSYTFMLWVLYIHYVSRGYIVTTRDKILNKILDYTCSAYIFVLGRDGRTIERFGKFTGCYPKTFPLSSQLEYNTPSDLEMLRKVSISWDYAKFEPMDPRILSDFNYVSQTEWLYKPKNWDETDYYSSTLVKPTTPKGTENLATESEKDSVDTERPSVYWNKIETDAERGCSGKIPESQFQGTTNSSSIRTTDIANEFWGGYPYIANGSELIYVAPANKNFDETNTDGLSNKNRDVIY